MKSEYDYKNGTPIIKQHSVAKNKILQAYLEAYYPTLVSTPKQDKLSLTIVDAFAGSGLYFHQDTKELIKGSPLIILESAKLAEYTLNQNRYKPLHFDIDYFFIEKNRAAHSQLKYNLTHNGFDIDKNEKIHLIHSEFEKQITGIVEFINKKSPISGRSIFILDQYGYIDVPAHTIKKIFTHLPKAEVILTFAADSFLNFANDNLSKNHLRKIGLINTFSANAFEEAKKTENGWRLFLQSTLYHSLILSCGAKHYTPFFIRTQGHGDYWLIHLSQHHKARDVMTSVHWQYKNHFIHYGGAGMDMFQMNGYDPKNDHEFLGQSQLFEFDSHAEKLSKNTLMEQIPHRIYSHDSGLSFGELYVSSCNQSPATEKIFKETIATLAQEKVLDIVTATGSLRHSAQQICHTDQIMRPKQGSIFFP